MQTVRIHSLVRLTHEHAEMSSDIEAEALDSQRSRFETVIYITIDRYIFKPFAAKFHQNYRKSRKGISLMQLSFRDGWSLRQLRYKHPYANNYQ